MKKSNRHTLTDKLSPLGGVLLVTLMAVYVPPFHVRAATPPALDEHAVLGAIAEVETGATSIRKPCRKIGLAGERSAWQMTEAVWKSYTAEPFAKASTTVDLAHLIASLHLRYLRMMLELRGIPVTVYSLALAWNGGVRVGLYTPAHHDYAARVANIYADGFRRARR